MIYRYGERYRVRIFRANVQGGEIHLLAKAETRKGLADFLRVLAGRVAVTVSGARKGAKKIGKFWNELCWSRLLNWGAEFFQARAWFTGKEVTSPVGASNGSGNTGSAGKDPGGGVSSGSWFSDSGFP
jgi:hypothetical protein